ncbi:hypothetical protein GQ457_16G009440 [Hibiscus cannabinus]
MCMHFFKFATIIFASLTYITPDRYYSLYRHVEIMAREVQRGANSVHGVEATIWQVPETLSDIILQKMKAPAKATDVARTASGC